MIVWDELASVKPVVLISTLSVLIWLILEILDSDMLTVNVTPYQ